MKISVESRESFIWPWWKRWPYRGFPCFSAAAFEPWILQNAANHFAASEAQRKSVSMHDAGCWFLATLTWISLIFLTSVRIHFADVRKERPCELMRNWVQSAWSQNRAKPLRKSYFSEDARIACKERWWLAMQKWANLRNEIAVFAKSERNTS